MNVDKYISTARFRFLAVVRILAALCYFRVFLVTADFFLFICIIFFVDKQTKDFIYSKTKKLKIFISMQHLHSSILSFVCFKKKKKFQKKNLNYIVAIFSLLTF